MKRKRSLVTVLLFFCICGYSQNSWVGKYEIKYSQKNNISCSEIEIEESEYDLESLGEYEWVFKAYRKDTLSWYYTGYAFLSNGRLLMVARNYVARAEQFSKRGKKFLNSGNPIYEIIKQKDVLYIKQYKRKLKLRLVPLI